MTIASRISDPYTKHVPATGAEQSVCTVILEFEVLTPYSVAVLQQLMAAADNLLTQTVEVSAVEEVADEPLMSEDEFLNFVPKDQEPHTFGDRS
jgi:hypothetical protein